MAGPFTLYQTGCEVGLMVLKYRVGLQGHTLPPLRGGKR